MKIILIELNLQCLTATHQSVLTSILVFILLSKVATTQQTDSTTHKLKPRSFYKSAHLWAILQTFTLSVNHTWHLVWVDSSNISSNHPAKKLAFKRAGLFPVIKKVGPSAYKLQIPKMWKNLYPVINKSKLKPYHRPTFTQQQETLLTVIIPNQESSIQEVERILNSRI